MLNWNPWKQNRLLREEIKYLKRSKDRVANMSDRWLDRACNLSDVLAKIAAEEKPTSNATVRRMARMAREALKQ